MKFRFNWKTAILSAIVVAAAGMAFYVYVGSKIDFACRYDAPPPFGCSLWNAMGIVVNAYADFIMRFVAPQCVGGNGPDDCIGPALLLMMLTYLVVGFVLGGLIFREPGKTYENTAHKK